MSDQCINRERHPVGTRLLVTIPWLGMEDGTDPQIQEIFVQEWSPGGLVKLRYAGAPDEDEYAAWRRPERVTVVECLEPEPPYHHDFLRGWNGCTP
jgi:hypothetical protein